MTEGWLVVKTTFSLGLLLPYFILTIFIAVFPKTTLLLRWIVDIVKGIMSSLEELCESCCYFFFSLCHVMKMCHVCCYNSSDATFRLLMSGDINPNPEPVSASTAGKINCLVMNARSSKSYPKDSTTNWQSVCNLHRFQDLVYPENSDVICVNETWLNQNISNSEILHSGFTILRRDRSDRGGGRVLIAIKTASFKAVKVFKPYWKPSCNSLRSFLPKLLRLLVKEFYSVFAIGHPMKTQVGWIYSLIFCLKFVASSTIWYFRVTLICQTSSGTPLTAHRVLTN